MREQMLNDYLAAIAKSHDHRAKTLQFNVRLGRPTVRNLGFQPLDITSQFLDERLTLVAVTNYFDPAVHLTRVSCDGSSLFCEEVATIRGVQGGKDEYHRMFFQDVDTVKGTNRLDTVNFDANGLWVSRNGLPEMLHIHPPKSEAESSSSFPRTIGPTPGSSAGASWRMTACCASRARAGTNISPWRTTGSMAQASARTAASISVKTSLLPSPTASPCTP